MWLLLECMDVFQSKHMGFGDIWGAGQSTHHMNSAKKCLNGFQNVTHFVRTAQVAARLDRNRQVVYLTGTADALKAPGMTFLLCKNGWSTSTWPGSEAGHRKPLRRLKKEDANQHQRRTRRRLGVVKVDWEKERSSENGGSIDLPSPSDLVCSFKIIDCRNCHFPLLLGYRGSTFD